MVKIKVSFSAKLMRIFTVSLIIHRQGRISQGTSAAAWFKSKDQNRNYSTLSQVMQLAKLKKKAETDRHFCVIIIHIPYNTSI